MSDSRPVDPQLREDLRHRLKAWLDQRRQSLLEEATEAWQGALSRLQPDEALLTALLEGTTPVPPASEQPGLEAPFEQALDLIEGATGQGDLMRRLLEATAPLAPRSALYILRQGQASLYSHRGFGDEAVPRPAAVPPTPDLEALIQGQSAFLRQPGPGYTALLEPLVAQAAADLAIFPLRHRRKAVALLLVDCGAGARLEAPGLLRALVLATSATLAALAVGKEEPPPVPPVPPPPREPGPARTPDPAPDQPAELDPRTRAAAERLARVLVEDLELYFPARITQARGQGNLYGLLRAELDRSRATFAERFGESVENQYRIFTNTVIQRLCDGDVNRLGPAPWA